jgi:hypothetical protein
MAEGPDPRSRGAHHPATKSPNSRPDSLRAREEACFGRCLASTTHHAYTEPTALSSQVGSPCQQARHGSVEGGTSRLTGGTRDMFRCCSHPWRGWSAGAAPGRAFYQAKPKSQVVILHTRPWLSLLAELSGTSPGVLDVRAVRWILPAGQHESDGPLGVVQDWSDRNGES